MLIANTFFVLLFLIYNVATTKQNDVVDSKVSNTLPKHNKFITNHPPSIDTYDVVADEDQIEIDKYKINLDGYKSLDSSIIQPYTETYEDQLTITTIPKATTISLSKSGKHSQRARKIKNHRLNHKDGTASEDKISVQDEEIVLGRSFTDKNVSTKNSNLLQTTSERIPNPLTKIGKETNSTTGKDKEDDLLTKTNTTHTFPKRPAEFNPVIKKKRQRDPVVKIISEKNFVFAHSGNYHYSYEGGDGTKISSQGELKKLEDNTAGAAVVGSVFYKDKDGNDVSLSYTADENGYRPQGAHLPTPPPIPPAIARALRYLATKPTEQPVTEALNMYN